MAEGAGFGALRWLGAKGLRCRPLRLSGLSARPTYCHTNCHTVIRENRTPRSMAC